MIQPRDHLQELAEAAARDGRTPPGPMAASAGAADDAALPVAPPRCWLRSWSLGPLGPTT